MEALETVPGTVHGVILFHRKLLALIRKLGPGRRRHAVQTLAARTALTENV
jgi:hypothetical protein